MFGQIKMNLYNTYAIEKDNYFVANFDGFISNFTGEALFLIEGEKIEVEYDSVEFHGNFILCNYNKIFVPINNVDISYTFYKDGDIVAFYWILGEIEEVRFFSEGFDPEKTEEDFVAEGGTVVSYGDYWSFESPHKKVQIFGTDFYIKKQKYDYKKIKGKGKNAFVLEF